MTRYLGIDEETGFRMFVDKNTTLRLELPKCPCCGGEELLSHATKFGGEYVCTACGDKWASYLSGRSRLDKLGVRATHRVVLNQLARINYWIEVKNNGYLAPANLEQDRSNIKNYLDFYGLSSNIKSKVIMEERFCTYCGRYTKVPKGSSRPKCPECESRYKRYRYLQTHLGELTLEDCNEFHAILDTYVDLMHRGFWAPDIPKYRKKIWRRMDELV